MSHMSLPVQLPLGVQLRDDATFANYYSGQNETLVKMLDVEQSSPVIETEQFMFLYGASGVGCSHLLQAACHQVDRRGSRSIYLPMKELIHYSPQLLEGIEHLQLVCLDDIDEIAGIPDWEEAIFDLFNRLRDAHTRFLVAAHHGPKQLNIQLPDLVSRLSWGLVMGVHPLSESEQEGALKLRARLRGFDLSDDVARYIVHCGGGDMAYLFSLLQQLDSASLRAKRKITIPFIKEVVAKR